MLKHATSLLLIAGMLLSACSSQGQSSPKANQTKTSTDMTLNNGKNKPTTSNEMEPEKSTKDTLNDLPNQANEETVGTNPVAPSTNENSSEVLTKKTYHMNSSYVIKPNNESSPDKVVLLTFDDGPKDEKMITSIINTLNKHQAKAIFFINGNRVKRQPEILKLIHKEGQVIGNHAWDHEDLKTMSGPEARKQITEVQQIVKDTIGEEPQFFRPPFGSGNDALKDAVKEQGMLYMTWSNGSLDWDKSTKNKPDRVIQNVLDQLHPGSNILMHELPWTVEALDELLTQLENKGYSFVDPQSIELQPR
ncbi:polysaccharide deacetylase family protein [Paenibacillus sp. 2TAF8]|uniref:polysaccharide deacetylase family protein n=1 Tax=Paenibacillus sp. 2TAF8 TaxID=3233020 RepID=UPI003F99FE70